MGMVKFVFRVYTYVRTCTAGFYLEIAQHVELSARYMPGELSTGGHRMGQINARKKIRNRNKFSCKTEQEQRAI